jgi:hypothetical protein
VDVPCPPEPVADPDSTSCIVPVHAETATTTKLVDHRCRIIFTVLKLEE